MSAIPVSVVCERVRAQVSLELDGELSELERRMLDAHLGRCAQCATYASDVRDLTAQIRAAPLEEPQRPVVVRRSRSLSTTRLHVGVAAALAFAALGLGTQLAASESQSPSLERFEGQPSLSPPARVLEREQAILQVVRPGKGLPRPGSLL